MLEDLEKEVIEWAKNKGIPLEPSNAIAQIDKAQEEMSELVCEVHHKCVDEIKGELGDVLVTMCIQAAIWDTNLEECLALAVNKITKRTGKIVNGVFVKDGA